MQSITAKGYAFNLLLLIFCSLRNEFVGKRCGGLVIKQLHKLCQLIDGKPGFTHNPDNVGVFKFQNLLVKVFQL